MVLYNHVILSIPYLIDSLLKCHRYAVQIIANSLIDVTTIMEIPLEFVKKIYF